VVESKFVALLHPDAVSEPAGSAEFRLMLLLHFLASHVSVPLVFFFLEVTEQLENSVSDRETGLVDVLLADEFRVHSLSLELED